MSHTDNKPCIIYAAENAATGTAGKLWRSAGCHRYVRGIAEDVWSGRGAIQTTNFQERCAIVDVVVLRLV